MDQYQEYVVFTEIFKNGQYNCVTSVALYGLILEHYGVPFQIKELPKHVYLVAFPNLDRIVLQTTDPTFDSFQVSKTIMKKKVSELKKMKRVSALEIAQKGYLKVYDEHLEDESTISMTELVGIMYHNDFVYYNNKGNKEWATILLAKSYSLCRIKQIKENFGLYIFWHYHSEYAKDSLEVAIWIRSIEMDAVGSGAIKNGIFNNFNNLKRQDKKGLFQYGRTQIEASTIKNELKLELLEMVDLLSVSWLVEEKDLATIRGFTTNIKTQL